MLRSAARLVSQSLLSGWSWLSKATDNWVVVAAIATAGVIVGLAGSSRDKAVAIPAVRVVTAAPAIVRTDGDDIEHAYRTAKDRTMTQYLQDLAISETRLTATEDATAALINELDHEQATLMKSAAGRIVERAKKEAAQENRKAEIRYWEALKDIERSLRAVLEDGAPLGPGGGLMR